MEEAIYVMTTGGGFGININDNDTPSLVYNAAVTFTPHNVCQYPGQFCIINSILYCINIYMQGKKINIEYFNQ